MLTDDGLFSLPLLTHTLDKEITQNGYVDGHVTYRTHGIHICLHARRYGFGPFSSTLSSSPHIVM